MKHRTIGIALSFFVIIGVVLIVVTEVMGVGEMTLLTKEVVPTFSNIPQAQQIYWYKLDIFKYLNNVADQFNATKWVTYIPQQPPELQFTVLDAITLGTTAVAKITCWLVNWLEFIMYFATIFIIKITVAYPLSVIFALLGIDTTELGNAVLQILNFQPPYININW